VESISALARKIPRNAWEAIWRLPDEITIPEWVEKNINLSEKMAAEAGPLRISRTPYIEGPLLALQDIFVEQIVLLWGRQLAKSTTVYSFVCYIVAQDPGPATFLLPTRDKAKEIQETKLDPIFRACQEVMNRMPENPDDYTKLRMNFQTMVLAMAWAGSDTQTTTRSNRYLLVDEADEIKKQVGESAIDPIKGIRQTMTTFTNRKEIDSGTPTTPEGNIWQELKSCQLVFEYWIPCPHCGARQLLYWENVKFGDNHDPIVVEEIAYYECEVCQRQISNLDKLRMLAKGEWRARTTPDPCDQVMKNVRAKEEETISLDAALKTKRVKKIGFHLPKWYSPFSGGTFGVIAKEFLDANKALKEGDDFAPMRNWRIYNAARPWEEVAISETETELMKNRIDLPPPVCPKGTIALTCGVDAGQGGFWFAVMAWKRDYSAHLVHYGWLAGGYETSDLEQLIGSWVYEVDQEERQLRIWRIGLDTGGGQYSAADTTMTEAAYLFIRKMRRPGLFGTKGMSRDSVHRIKESRIDRMPGDKGAIIPGGLILIELNTGLLKDVVWFHLRIPPKEITDPATGEISIDASPPGRFTFHSATETDYVKHLLAEEKRLQKNGEWEWIRTRRDNHYLDCTVIAYAMADSELRGGIRVIRSPAPRPEGETEPKPPDSVNPITDRPRGDWMKGYK
jgi:phage terminase large subunit GpA-like protein